MAKIRVIKKNDDYSMDYQVGDILEVTGTWYGGINVNSKTGIFLMRNIQKLPDTGKRKTHRQ